MSIDFSGAVDFIGRSVEGLGIAAIVVGVVVASGRYIVRLGSGGQRPGAYQEVRQSIGRSILLGLELLVAGDIIRTVVVDPTFTSVGVLAGIVAIRTFLSFTLEMEVTGRWPWQAGKRPDTGVAQPG